MHRPERKLFITILALTVSLGLSAQNYVFRSLTPREGFPTSVNGIYAEDNGYAWVASSEGLVRIDNTSFRTFTHNTSLNSLPHNNVFQVGADLKGNIWALTEGGLARYSPVNDDFNIATTEGDSEDIPVVAYSIYPVEGGMIVGSDNRLYRYSNGNFKLKLLKEFMPGTDYPINSIFSWDEGHLLLHSKGQVPLLYDLKSNEIALLPFEWKDASSVIHVDSDGNIWSSSYNRGLKCFDHNGNLKAEYTTGNNLLHSDIVLSITEDEDNIWIGTNGGGINIISKSGRLVQTLSHERDDPSFIPADAIQSIYCDRNGTIWAGRIRGGVITIRKSHIQSYLSGANQYKSKSEGIVKMIEARLDDCIWMGTDGSGIIKFSPSDNSFRYFPETDRMKINDIARYDGTRMLISTVANGFFTLNVFTGHLESKSFGNDDLENYVRYSGKSVNLYYDNRDNVYILADKIYRINPGSGKMDTFPVPSDTEPGELNGIDTSDDRILFHSKNAIYAWDTKADMLTLMVRINRDATINSATLGDNERIWLATDDGIGYYSMAEDKFYPVDSIFLRGAQSVVYDFSGRVWVGTNRGLYLYYPIDRDVVSLGSNEGASDNEYLPKSRIVSRNGDIYLGGVRGFLRIDSRIDFDFSETPELILSDVRVSGEKASDISNLKLKPGYQNLDIDIFAKEKNILRSKFFRFRVTGPKRNEVSVTLDPTYSIHYEKAGKYKVYASCTTTSGRWTDWTEILDFTIKRKWFLSWWFLLSVLAVLAGLGLFLFERRIKERHEKAIREADQERIKFLVNVSHELRTPLTLVLGPLGRILKTMPENDPNYGQLTNINRQALRMRSLLNTVLTAHKIEEGASALNIKPHNLSDWLKQVISGFKDEAGGHGISIETDLSPEIKYVSFDDDKCHIVLSNILMNALKHSPENSTITVSSDYRPEDDMVRIAISDQGSGISIANADRLFERFYQETEDKSGFGIGLSYCKTIVEQNGGRIGAYNNADAGATFYFDLPLERATELAMPEKNKQETRHKKNLTLKDISILLADDNMDFRDYICSEISNRVKRIEVASNGKEALGIIKSEQIDIVLSDIMMPQMDGFQLCHVVKSDSSLKHIPVILLTARSDENSRTLGLKCGADNYLVKPFDIDMLIAAMEKTINAK